MNTLDALVFPLFVLVIVVFIAIRLMRFIRRFRRKLVSSGLADSDVTGESFYQKNFETIAGGRTEDSASLIVTGRLVPEPRNEHDRNAIRVEVRGHTIGYIPRGETADYHAALRGRPANVRIEIVGGWDRGERGSGHYGAKLDVAWPPRLE